MVATQSNSNVTNKEDAPCKSGTDNRGAQRGKQGSVGQGHPPQLRGKPAPASLRRQGRAEGPGLWHPCPGSDAARGLPAGRAGGRPGQEAEAMF